jgi:hypothetical protein
MYAVGQQWPACILGCRINLGVEGGGGCGCYSSLQEIKYSDVQGPATAVMCRMSRRHQPLINTDCSLWTTRYTLQRTLTFLTNKRLGVFSNKWNVTFCQLRNISSYIAIQLCSYPLHASAMFADSATLSAVQTPSHHKSLPARSTLTQAVRHEAEFEAFLVLVVFCYIEFRSFISRSCCGALSS